MLQGAFDFGKKPAAQPQPHYAPQPQYAPQPVAPAPAPVPVAPPQYAPQPAPEDPEVAKLKVFFLKWLSIIIGGLAILLIVWRVVLKFF